MWTTPTVECYLAIKGNEIPIHAVTWKLENMRRERSQTQKATHYMTKFM